jgi:hypothetical protein
MAVFGGKTGAGGKIFISFYVEFPQKRDNMEDVRCPRARSLTFCTGKGAGEAGIKEEG